MGSDPKDDSDNSSRSLDDGNARIGDFVVVVFVVVGWDVFHRTANRCMLFVSELCGAVRMMMMMMKMNNMVATDDRYA